MPIITRNSIRFTQKPSFWIFQSILAVICFALAFHFYPRAFPIVDLKISMDRTSALHEAATIARQHGWGPKDFQQAATFEVDQQTQTFVELAEGGSSAFSEILKSGIYSPYTWNVRHFAEGQTTETELEFTPEGEFYGFQERLPEDEPGAALTVPEAQSIAENSAREGWKLDFSPYHLVEKSHETLPGKRVDHVFVYERTKEQIGDGKYRLSLGVSGDRLTSIQHFIQIPDAFARHYAEMRSANDTIAVMANAAMIVLYFLGCCGLGLFFLARQKWVIWRTPVCIGGIVAAFQLFEQLNQLPLMWMHYDTAVPASGFLIKTVFSSIISFLSEWFLLTFSFMAAESLSRRAFPHHPQLWKIWLAPQSNSVEILGRTLGGFLTTGLFFLYVVLAYFLGTHYFGWWSPSDTLFQPNSLSSYCPWFTSVANSLHAGFWEESLFRAVPLASAVLLGKRYSRRSSVQAAWLAGGFLLQALVFGAGHANYPAQPSYARVVELILPSFLFGALYVRFGLLPGIILHYSFDVISFAIPLFVATTPGIWVDRLLIIVISFLPLWIILLSRAKQKRWTFLTPHSLNGGWAPLESEVQQRKLQEVADHQRLNQPKNPQPLPNAWQNFIIGLGLACCLGGIYFVATFHRQVPALNVDRKTAIETARRALEKNGNSLSTEWEAVALSSLRDDDEDRFAWETSGPELYYTLLGKYLSAPAWVVRFIRFDREVAERAEEFQVFIAQEGRVVRIRHQLPEERAGASLTVEAAKKIALQAMRDTYQLEASQLKEVSSTASQLLHRKDWVFIFSDQTTSLPKGEARLAVRIAGDQATASRQFIFAPEDWSRAERGRENTASIIETLSFLLMGCLFFAGLIQAIIQWTQKKYDSHAFRAALISLSVVSLVDFVNSFPLFFGHLSTTEPFFNQMLSLVSLRLIKIFSVSLFLSLVVGWLHEEARGEWALVSLGESSRKKGLKIGAMAYALGLIGPTIIALAAKLLPPPLPTFGRLGALDKYVPLLGGLAIVEKFIFSTLFFGILTLFVHRLTAGWQRRHFLGSALVFWTGMALVGTDPDHLLRWIFLGALAGFYLWAVYRWVLRFNLDLLPLAVAALFIFSESKQMALRPYAGSEWVTLINFLIIITISIIWHRRLRWARFH